MNLVDQEKMRADQLYELLPVVYRQRDAAEGYPLKALLQVMGEQVSLVEKDIEQLYENWFVETAVSWAVPYIGQLVGYEPVRSAGRLGETSSVADQQLNKVLVPRREVTNTIWYRRRKGTLALLEELARDVTGWQVRAVEFARLLSIAQSVNHPQSGLAQTINLRNQEQLLNLNTPFDQAAHIVDVRRLHSKYQPSFYHLNNVGVFVWRLRSYSVTMMSPYLLEDIGTHCFTFSVLGNDIALFTKAIDELSKMTIASELNVPAPIRRYTLHANLDAYYGESKSIAIYREDSETHEMQLVPVEQIIAADLSDWVYQPEEGMIALDPELGRFALSPLDRTNGDIRVTYHYGFSADLGGGEYGRKLSQPANVTRYQVIPGIKDNIEKRLFSRIGNAVACWDNENPANGLIEIVENGVYTEQLHIKLSENQTLQIRSANRVRPVLRLLDFNASRTDALRVHGKQGSSFTIDGLIIAGRGLMVSGPMTDVAIRHSTLVPGWTLTANCEPNRPAEPSLTLNKTTACITVDRSIIGSIQVKQDEVSIDPPPIIIRDSILDATDSERSAIDAPSWPIAHAILTILNSTIIGTIDAHAIELAENSIFTGRVYVGRSQIGCMRFCYVPPDSRTPKRYNCQPDNVIAQCKRELPDIKKCLNDEIKKKREIINSIESSPDEIAKAMHAKAVLEKQLARVPLKKALEIKRVFPQFNSLRYGTSTYCQLSKQCAVEIKRGAENESEMGVFYHLFQPQREASLKARLEEYTPADMHVGIIIAS